MTTILTDERRAALDRKGYSVEDVEAVERWVIYCAHHIGIAPKRVEVLRSGLRSLSRFAQGEWNAVQRDHEYVPSLWTGQLGGFSLGEREAENFVMLTGDVLLAGADGPQVTAKWMEEALDKLIEGGDHGP